MVDPVNHHLAPLTFSDYIILIVDDTPANLAVLADYLGSYGFEIMTARSGEMALKRVQYALPDIILLDVLMPGIDGFETCQRLKADEVTQHIPVIFMTALTDPEHKVKGFAAGAVDYVTKPFHQEEVLARVRAHLRIRSLTRGLQVTNETLSETVDELKRTRKQLVVQEKLATLNQLAGKFGHELRNPLGVIANCIYFLQNALPGSDGLLNEYLAIMGVEIGKAEQIISALLDLSDMQSANRVEIAVSDLVTWTLVDCPPPDGVKVVISIDDEPCVFVDGEQIRQALVNLVTNAYQAMPDGGEMHFMAQVKWEQVQLSLVDTGEGISGASSPKIFEPLFSTKMHGLGLGLTVAKNLIELNGGSLAVESNEGQGTICVVTLPMRV